MMMILSCSPQVTTTTWMSTRTWRLFSCPSLGAHDRGIRVVQGGGFPYYYYYYYYYYRIHHMIMIMMKNTKTRT